MAQQIEKESNRMCEYDWVGEAGSRKLKMTWYDGITEWFDPRLATVTNQANAQEYGWGVRFNRLCAVEVKDFPDKKLRAEEGRRRQREYRDHIYSGSDSWEMARQGRAPSGPNEADLAEILDRKVAGKGQAMLAALIKKHGGELPKAREDVLARTEFAVIWAQIQNERRLERAKAAPSVGTADDLVASLDLE